MGFDLMGINRSYNWSSWRALYGLGVAFGWRPAGTLMPKTLNEFDYPPDDDPGPRSGYFHNDWQWTTDADARAWATALRRALDAMAGKSAMTAEQAEMVRKAKTDDFVGEPFAVPLADSVIEDMVRDFIDAIESRRGGFSIG